MIKKKFDWIYEIFIRFLQANRWWLDFSFNYLNVATSINSASIFDETSFSVAISLWKHEKQDLNVKQQVKKQNIFNDFPMYSNLDKHEINKLDNKEFVKQIMEIQIDGQTSKVKQII